MSIDCFFLNGSIHEIKIEFCKDMFFFVNYYVKDIVSKEKHFVISIVNNEVKYCDYYRFIRVHIGKVTVNLYGILLIGQ